MFRILSSALIAAAITTSPLYAQAEDGVTSTSSSASLIEDVGASERINFSGKSRMLTQRVAAAACYDHYGIATESSGAMLQAASTELDRILNALEYGDEGLGIIGAETDRRVLMDLEQAHAIWDPLHTEIEDIIATGGTDEEVIHIAIETERTLDVAKHLVSVLVGEYADPTALLQADAMTIDIAGRQRMLAQRISKNVCLLANGVEIEGALDQLSGAVRIYQASVMALRNGMLDAGINPPPTDEIAAGLDSVIADWNAVQPILATVMEGGEISTADQETIFNQMNSLTGQMNTLVEIYTEESKLDL